MLGWLFGRRAPRLPLPPKGIDEGSLNLMREAAFAQLRKQYGDDVRGDLHDAVYCALRFEDMPRVANWLGEVHDAMDFAGFGYRESVSDCDDIAALAMALRRLLPLPRTPLAVRQSVHLRGGGLHMDNAFFTEEGWVMVEPQTGEYWTAEEYPHRTRWVFVQ